MSGFINEFIERGFLYQCTALEELKEITSTKSIAGYIGFDCTAKSLHVGSMVQIMTLRMLQKHGHKPIVIIGDATSKIGDPTGKDEIRRVLSDEELRENAAGIKKSLSKFIKFGNGKSDALMLHNNDWLGGIGYIDCLKEYGKFISVNKMLSIESAKARLEREQQLTFLEFNYMLMQAFDFCHLYKNHECILQIGGSDQWGNIIMGVDLAHKKYQAQVFGLTTQLLTTASGAKMGKSVSGAVWLNEDMLSPYEYYQYWRNTDDRDVVKFAQLFAEYDKNEMLNFANTANSDINLAKKTLAHKLTALCHGEEEAIKAHEMSVKIFEQGFADDNLPTIFISKTDIISGIPAFELFYIANLVDSKSESKKLIRGMGAKINDERVTDENFLINEKFFIDGKVKLSVGKKRHALLKIKDN